MCCCAHRATSALARRMPRLKGQPGVQSSSSAHQSAAKAAATQSRRHRGARGAALGFCQVKSRRWGPQVSPESASIATETQAPASLRSHARPPLAPYSAAGSGHAARGAARTQAQRLEMQRRGRQEAASEARAPRTDAPRSSTPTPSSDPTWPWRATHTFCNPSNKRPRFLVSFWHEIAGTYNDTSPSPAEHTLARGATGFSAAGEASLGAQLLWAEACVSRCGGAKGGAAGQAG